MELVFCMPAIFLNPTLTSSEGHLEFTRERTVLVHCALALVYTTYYVAYYYYYYYYTFFFSFVEYGLIYRYRSGSAWIDGMGMGTNGGEGSGKGARRTMYGTTGLPATGRPESDEWREWPLAIVYSVAFSLSQSLRSFLAHFPHIIYAHTHAFQIISFRWPHAPNYKIYPYGPHCH